MVIISRKGKESKGERGGGDHGTVYCNFQGLIKMIITIVITNFKSKS